MVPGDMQTKAKPQQASPPEPEKNRAFDHAAMIADAVARQGPPPTGMGKLVDKTV
jgi:hypothetical protein